MGSADRDDQAGVAVGDTDCRIPGLLEARAFPQAPTSHYHCQQHAQMPHQIKSDTRGIKALQSAPEKRLRRYGQSPGPRPVL